MVKIRLVPDEEIPSDEREFLEHIIEIIEEKTFSGKGKVIAFGLMIEAAKSVTDKFIEFEEEYRLEPLETNILKKFQLYMNGYAHALENIGDIVDFIKTYVSPENYERYFKLYVNGLNMMISSLTETDFAKMLNILGDLDKIIKEDEFSEPEIIWEKIRDYIQTMP